jgi:hypothetical protein
MVHFLSQFRTAPWRPFLKNVLIVEKNHKEKRKVLIFGFGLYGGLYGQNLPYKFKKSYDDQESQHRKSTENYWSLVRSETGFVILSKFWSRYALQNFREQKFLDDDQSELIKDTVQLCTHLPRYTAVVSGY